MATARIFPGIRPRSLHDKWTEGGGGPEKSLNERVWQYLLSTHDIISTFQEMKPDRTVQLTPWGGGDNDILL